MDYPNIDIVALSSQRRGMRDDLHKAAPIAKALQKLMQMCGRSTDRADPARLVDAAIAPLQKEIERCLPAGAARHYADDDQNPALFRPLMQGPIISTFQQDLHAETAANPTASIADLLTLTLRIQIDSHCNESTSAMLAAGGSRKEVTEAVEAYRQAGHTAAPAAVRAFLGSERPKPQVKSLSLDDTIAAGPRA